MQADHLVKPVSAYGLDLNELQAEKVESTAADYDDDAPTLVEAYLRYQVIYPCEGGDADR